jgi:hypothetical protein
LIALSEALKSCSEGRNFSYQNQLYDPPAIDSRLNTNAAPHDELLGDDTHPFDETNFDIDPSPNESKDDIGEPMYDADNDVDDDSIVHCSDDELTMRQIRNNVVAPFSVTELTQLYILPVSTIQGPAIVVPDFITENELSNTNFFAVCPRRMLGHYFRRYCRKEDEDFAVDLDKSDRFDSDNEEFVY